MDFKEFFYSMCDTCDYAIHDDERNGCNISGGWDNVDKCGIEICPILKNKKLLEMIGEYWEKRPGLRLGQILLNLSRNADNNLVSEYRCWCAPTEYLSNRLKKEIRDFKDES